MNPARAAERLFAACLRLYPSRFRDEFGPELAEVFAESLRQAGREGPLAALAVGARELADFPVNLIAEHWEEFHMRSLQLDQPVLRPAWWGAVGFGCAAALADLLQTAMSLFPMDGAAASAGDGSFWGGFLLYAALGGIGGWVFALVCRQPGKTRLYFIAGSLGFLIGHLLWIAVMVAAGIGLFYAGAEDAVFLAGNVVVHWTGVALTLSLTALFIGWMEKAGRAGRLAGNALLGAGIGGLLGLGFCAVLMLLSPSVAGRSAIVTSLIFAINAPAGILGGALLGRALARGKMLRGSPAAS